MRAPPPVPRATDPQSERDRPSADQEDMGVEREDVVLSAASGRKRGGKGPRCSLETESWEGTRLSTSSRRTRAYGLRERDQDLAARAAFVDLSEGFDDLGQRVAPIDDRLDIA